jgi:selenocysteine lyase/cysteine desulfurase
MEHNAVMRPLLQLAGVEYDRIPCSREGLMDPADIEPLIRPNTKLLVMAHGSNVCGSVQEAKAVGAICAKHNIAFVLDAAQTAGHYHVHFDEFQLSALCVPGHKGLLGPMGTGLLLCNTQPKPLLCGGTGSNSASWEMPDFLPDVGEAGTANVPGIAGLSAALDYLQKRDMETLFRIEKNQAERCAAGLRELGFRVFYGEHQSGTVSFVPTVDCEEAAQHFAGRDIAVRAGLHCAPLAHESAGTLETGTLRISFGHDTTPHQTQAFLKTAKNLL